MVTDRKQTLIVWGEELRQPQLESDYIGRGSTKGRIKEGGYLEERRVRKRKTAAWSFEARETDRRLLTYTLPSKHNQKLLWNRNLKWLKVCACVVFFPQSSPSLTHRCCLTFTTSCTFWTCFFFFSPLFAHIASHPFCLFSFSLRQWFCWKSSPEGMQTRGFSLTLSYTYGHTNAESNLFVLTPCLKEGGGRECENRGENPGFSFPFFPQNSLFLLAVYLDDQAPVGNCTFSGP